MYKASLDTKAQFPHRKLALRVQGIVFDDIAPVSPACDSTNVHNRREADLRANWAELALGDTDTDAYIAGGTNVNALQHSLCIDTQIIDRRRITCGGSVARLDSATCKEWWASFSSPILVQDATHYRRLIKTSLGYFGRAPYQWQTGDIVWILFGSQFPMILRPEDGHFFLVGHCYVHGIMDNEALEESGPQERDENVRDLMIVALMVQNQLGTHALARCLRQIPVCHGQLANAE